MIKIKKWRVKWFQRGKFEYSYTDSLKEALKKRVVINKKYQGGSVLSRRTPLAHKKESPMKYLPVGGFDCLMGFKPGATSNRHLKEEGFDSFDELMEYWNNLHNPSDNED